MKTALPQLVAEFGNDISFCVMPFETREEIEGPEWAFASHAYDYFGESLFVLEVQLEDLVLKQNLMTPPKTDLLSP